MKWKRASNKFGKTPVPGGNRWCLAFCGAMGLAALSTSGLIYQSAQASIVSIDPVVLRENWLSAYNYATDQAALTLNTYANENDPFADIGQRSVTVDVTSIVRSSEDSFEIRWREKSFRGGALLDAQTYTASLSIITKAPTDAETLHRNPLGLYIHGLFPL